MDRRMDRIHMIIDALIFMLDLFRRIYLTLQLYRLIPAGQLFDLSDQLL